MLGGGRGGMLNAASLEVHTMITDATQISSARMPPTRLRFVPLLAGAAAIALVLACQTVAGPLSSHVVDIEATDYAFDVPATLQPGDITFRLVNHGQEEHQAQVLRLKDGVSADQFINAFESQGPAALAMATAEGGPAIIAPNASQDVSLSLQPGNYLFTCFVAGPDGVPHIAKGMSRAVRVTGSAISGPPPATSGTFTLRDFTFDMPSSLRAGLGTYQVVNEGPQLHELVLLKVAPGTTAEGLRTFLDAPAGDPPFTSVGGMQAFQPGGSGTITLNLQPGTYAAICHVPDPASGVAHLDLGMIKLFTVN